MNRRGFLQRLALVPIAGIMTDDLFELLQPRATIILPPVTGWPVASQVWSVNSLGGYFYSRALSQVLRQSLLRRLNQIEGPVYGCRNETL
jgi:hypothetical protein